MATKTDLMLAFEALNGKLPIYNELFNYAEGEQPLIYSTARLHEAFNNINAHFSQNWCSVVINAALDRLTLKGWDCKDKGVNDALDEQWYQNGIELDAYEVHEAALITSESFLIVWKDDAGDIEEYFNDPRMCHVFYKSDQPKVKRFAAKWWSDGAVYHMTLYYPDRLEYYETAGPNLPTSSKAFKPAKIPSIENPYGEIPVFHFRTSRRSRNGELGKIKSLQDAVNKLFADMMIAAEFGAFPQRYIIGDVEPGALKNSPNEIWYVGGGDGQGQGTSVGQFAATQLDNYLNGIDKIANSIAIISRTPKHYFYNAGANLSGEALIAMEAPLTKKVQQYQSLFGMEWAEVGTFIAKLSGKEVNVSDVLPVWAPAESIQPLTEADVRTKDIASGIPLVTSLRRSGWGADDLKAMEQDRADEKKKTESVATLLLAKARLQQEQSNQPPFTTNTNAQSFSNNSSQEE